ncbi:MAG: HipA domain-containing protein, partial [Candidatus Sumerlaeota bacterium]
ARKLELFCFAQILLHHEGMSANLSEKARDKAMKDIMLIGTSAGGARAKAVVAWNPTTNEVRSGQVNAGPGYEYWLLKFDGVEGNKDKESNDSPGFSAIEFAYHLMAKVAGVEMMECRLLEEHGRRHFMTKRFDRTEDGKKIHMQSLCGLAHYDFNEAGAYSYEQAILVMRTLDLSPQAVEQQFRRMLFNVVARNQDDHTKNIAFLMDKSGTWSLAPAYDMMYSYNPAGLWTSTHQMTINGKRDGFTIEDFRAIGKLALLKRGRAETILQEVITAVKRWDEFAAQAKVKDPWRETIKLNHRLVIPLR